MKPKKNPNIMINRNSSIYFAIGLNLMLLLSWRLLEHKTLVKDTTAIELYITNTNDLEEDIPIVKIKTGPPPPPAFISHENTVIVDNAIEIEETIIESSESAQDDMILKYSSNSNNLNPSDIYIDDIEEEIDVPFAVIEKTPIFPGCEGLSKKESKACFERNMQAHIQRHFNYPKEALDLEIQGKVFVVFVIDSKGCVGNLRSRGPHRLLEDEAERIIGLLPRMVPGKQRNKPVRVTYGLPIHFKYQ
jgi:protein TonB